MASCQSFGHGDYSEIDYAWLANQVWVMIPDINGAAVVLDKYADVDGLNRVWDDWNKEGPWEDEA